MTFEFLVACRTTVETDVRQTLTDLLVGFLEDKQNSFNEGVLDDLVQIRHQRPVAGESGNTGTNGNATLIGFTVELPDDTRDAVDVVSDFVNALPDAPPISHVVKFEDPLLEAYLTERASEIFALEMKLRRVLSFVYLNAYQLEDPFNLLWEEREENHPPIPRPQPNQMKAAAENEFFHLTFGQYTNLNQRQDLDLSSFLTSIQNSENYDVLRTEISRLPIEDEEDARFIASLKDIIGPIGHMRNCVAHNRRPTGGIRNNYPNAHDQLDARMNEYLTRWEVEIAT